MGLLAVKRFTEPDETRPFVDKGQADILNFQQGVVGRGTFEPGWRWSTHVKPLAGTQSCQAEHACYVLSGRMHVVMDDGAEIEAGPGDVMLIPPGHDAWTVGSGSCVVLDFSGMEHYAVRERPQAQVESSAAEQPEVTTH